MQHTYLADTTGFKATVLTSICVGRKQTELRDHTCFSTRFKACIQCSPATFASEGTKKALIPKLQCLSFGGEGRGRGKGILMTHICPALSSINTLAPCIRTRMRVFLAL